MTSGRQGLYMFDDLVVLDWSASAKPKRGKDSIWIGQAGVAACAPVNLATRSAAMADLKQRIADSCNHGRRILVGADFPFAYPAGFARALTGKDGAMAIWDWLLAHVQDADNNANNRFQLADIINQRFPGTGPFWGRPSGLSLLHLPEKGSARTDMPFTERRAVEALEPGLQPVWKLYTTGSVGSQALLGIARLAALRKDLGSLCAVWPFEPIADAQVVLAEVWPSLLAADVRAAEGRYPCRDAAQVDLLARALAHLAPQDWAEIMPDLGPNAVEEGWILGAGKSALLRHSLARALTSADQINRRV